MILSIIVPVYNVEKYLERCIESLIHQDIEPSDYEIIMVNDGSTDHSGIIAEQLASKYGNIILFNQTNQGLSGARNSGLKLCRGKYVMFVDSDDFLEKNCLMNLITSCEQQQLDICHFPLMVEQADGSFSKDVFNTLSFNRIYNAYDINKDGVLIGSVCSNIIRRKLLDDYHLRFEVGITHEDVEFTTRLFCHVKRVMLVNSTVYYYMYNGSSLSKDQLFAKANKYLCDSARVTFLSKKYVREADIDKKLKKLIICRVNTGFVGLLINLLIYPKYQYESVQTLVETAKYLGVYPVKGYFSNLKIKIASLFLNNISMLLYLYKTRSQYAKM